MNIQDFMDVQDFLTFEDVEAIGSNGLALLCRVNGKEVWVPYANMVTRDGTVRRLGDRGLLIVPHWLAVNLELVDRACLIGLRRRSLAASETAADRACLASTLDRGPDHRAGWCSPWGVGWLREEFAALDVPLPAVRDAHARP